MGNRVEAKIYWLSEEQGGRRELPNSDKYAPIIRIIDSIEYTNDIWSIFVFNKKYLNGNETISVMKYLSDDAPDNLAQDVKFELYEGKKLVAIGSVLRVL